MNKTPLNLFVFFNLETFLLNKSSNILWTSRLTPQKASDIIDVAVILSPACRHKTLLTLWMADVWFGFRVISSIHTNTNSITGKIWGFSHAGYYKLHVNCCGDHKRPQSPAALNWKCWVTLVRSGISRKGSVHDFHSLTGLHVLATIATDFPLQICIHCTVRDAVT